MIKVIVVDDHGIVRSGIQKILNSTPGITVVGEAASGEECISMCRQLQPDVVIMDIKMPGIGGLNATSKLCRLYPDVRILVLTACDNDVYPARFMRLGAFGYLTKGCKSQEMLDAIRAVSKGQRYISSELANRLAFRQVSENKMVFEALSERELQVMLMITKGMKVETIAHELYLSAKTVNSYRYRIFEKLKIKNDVELTLLAIRNGLVESEEMSVENENKG